MSVNRAHSAVYEFVYDAVSELKKNGYRLSDIGRLDIECEDEPMAQFIQSKFESIIKSFGSQLDCILYVPNESNRPFKVMIPFSSLQPFLNGLSIPNGKGDTILVLEAAKTEELATRFFGELELTKYKLAFYKEKAKQKETQRAEAEVRANFMTLAYLGARINYENQEITINELRQELAIEKIQHMIHHVSDRASGH